MRYVISYDLLAPEKNYQPLWDALARMGAGRILQSQWIVRLQGASPVIIRDQLRPFIDHNDRLLVAEFDGSVAAWWNPMTDPSRV